MAPTHEERAKKAAAGPQGVWAATKLALQQMGGARAVKALHAVNQPDGFDCPSCAWPDPAKRHHAEFCENGAKAVAWEATRDTVGAEFFAQHPISNLQQQSGHWLESQGRLSQPVYRAAHDTHYRPIEWSAAFDIVAQRIAALDDPNEAVFYTSGRASNEAAFLYQLMARSLGTNNLPDCSNMCHESSGVALTQTIGVGKGTVSLEDIRDHADLIVIMGQNPGTNHPRMLTSLEALKKRGGRIVAINPLPEAGLMRFKNPQRPSGVVGGGTALSDVYLPVRVNGDLALLLEVNRRLVQRGAVDHSFIEAFTDGFQAAAQHWSSVDPVAVSGLTGLTSEQIEQFVDEVAGADRIIVCWAMGLTQHRNSVATIREVVNLLLLGGNIGRPGAGACPVRGHSNVQGDRTMGIYEKPTEAFLTRLDEAMGITSSRAPGLDVVDAITAMQRGRVGVFMTLGGNFASATPDTEATEIALGQVGLTVHVSTKLNRSHAVPGVESLILPSLGRSDTDVQAGARQFVTVEDSMSVVHRSQGSLRPPGEDVLSEPVIVAEIAHRLLAGNPIDWLGAAADYDRIRNHIESAIDGFDGFNARVREPNGFVLANPPRDVREFPTASGRARFTINQMDGVAVPEGYLLLQTMRSHDQFNTTVYGLDDRYRGVQGTRDVVFVHPDDLAAQNLRDGQRLDVVSVSSDGERRMRGVVAVAYPTPQGCAAAYFPEANVLIPLHSTALESNTPTSKSVVVRLEAAPVGRLS